MCSFLHVGNQLFQHHLLKSISLLLNFFGSFVETIHLISMGLFLDSIFWSIDLSVYPYANSTPTLLPKFIVNLEVR